MEKENLNEEVEVEQKSPLFQTTTVSKYLALVLFILMPFIGGWIGYSYGAQKASVDDNAVARNLYEKEKEAGVITNIPETDIEINKDINTVNADTSQNNVNNCNLIGNSSFRSINQYEAGNSPSGAVAGYWSITLQGGKAQWSHSDVSESGTYICNNNVLQVKFFDYSITAKYDVGKGILTWDGVEYKRVE